MDIICIFGHRVLVEVTLISLLDVGNRQHFVVAVSSRGLSIAKVKSVVSGDALLAAGLYSAAVSNATYVLSTRGFCREMIHKR